jgi:formylmethanofuran dehydrogenase subunit C
MIHQRKGHIIMSTSTGSKIAMAVAGLILIAGTATAIAMTQKDGGTTLPLIGAQETAPAQNGKNLIPDSAEEIVPGMKNLENGDASKGSDGSVTGTGTIFDEPVRTTE